MNHSKAITLWLSAICFLIFLTVVVGGVTRLTHSGLSMVEWKPILGVFPPVTSKTWNEKFTAYRRFPEYQKLNPRMTLGQFKFIFFWEYLHRLLGRTIGVVFLLPYLFFLVRGAIPRHLRFRLLIIFLLGGCQGLLGWFMVQSGLADDPHVSHYRLTAHLCLALLIYSLVFWMLLDYKWHVKGMATCLRWGWRPVNLIALLVGVQIAWGGLVAGLKAGFAYNTFPKINGEWIPLSLFSLDPWVRNFWDHPAGTQFIHRLLGWAVLLSIAAYWLSAKKLASSGKAPSLHLLPAAAVLQFLLGVLTLVYHVPLVLAALHQAGAVLLLSTVLLNIHREGRVQSFK